jgi:sulfoxide reductase heme-binding subunit YedZ
MTPVKRENGYALAPQSLLAWIGVTLVASAALFGALFLAPSSQIGTLQIEAWQLWARYTARLSFFLFLAVYLASPLYQLAQNKATHWLRVNRRNAGISFGIAHIIHLGALIMFLILSGRPTGLETLIVGGGAYVAMFAMLATSTDGAIRRLGAQNWRRLHKFGVHYLAFVFLATYMGGVGTPDAKPMALIVLIWAAIVLRLYVHFTKRNPS